MPEKWTGRLIGRMHNERVTYEELGEKLGIGKAYISMILNGKRKPLAAQERLEGALEEILRERKEGEENAEAAQDRQAEA